MGEMGAALVARDKCDAKGADTGAYVIGFPVGTDAKFRLLVRLIGNCICRVSGLRSRVEEIGISSNAMVVDDYACVFTGESVKDMHFVLNMKAGRKVLLITDKLPVMAHFIAGYLIRRHEDDPELASYL